MDVDEAATRLYAMPLDQFIATRKLVVAEARAAGEPAVALEVAELRKPSVAAWLVNQLARLDPAPLAGLTDVGTRLREAQSAMRGTDLRALARERSARVDEAMARVAALAADRDVILSPAVSAELHGTFVAAVATPEAGAVVRSGRLVRALSYAGFGDVDLDEALAGSAPSAAPTASGAARAKSSRADPDAAAAHRLRARRDEAEARVEARRDELDALTRQQATAEAQLAGLEERLEAAQAALVALVGRKGKALRALREAEATLRELG